jgi:hypothetical protein
LQLEYATAEQNRGQQEVIIKEKIVEVKVEKP